MRQHILVVSVLTALVFPLGGVVSAEDPPTMEQAKKQLNGIKNLVTNANLRIRHSGASGLRAGTDIPEKQTPGAACCTNHIERIGAKVDLLTGIFSDWDLYYVEQKNDSARETLKLMREQLNAVAIATAQFRMAVTRDRAIQALQGLVPPYLALVETTGELDACCPLPKPKPAKPVKNQRTK